MRYVIALIYAVLAFIVTQKYFSRFDDPWAGYTIFLVFAYAAFNLTRRTLLEWADFMVAPIDRVSVHARLVICMLAPLLISTILARTLYVATGISPFLAAIIFTYPWLWITDRTHRFLFPTSGPPPSRGIVAYFIPLQLRDHIGD